MPITATKRPRDADFEVPDLKRTRQNVARQNKTLLRRIPGHLWDALLSQKLVDFFRSKSWLGFADHDEEELVVWRYLGTGGFG